MSNNQKTRMKGFFEALAYWLIVLASLYFAWD